MNENIEWKTKKRELLLQTRIMSVNTQTSISPEGDESSFIILDAPNWVVCIATLDREQAKKDFNIDEECFLMVNQWRHGSEELSIEFPGGVIDSGEAPSTAAKRELLEETGYKAGALTHLGSVNPNPAIFSNTFHIYCAKDLENTHSLNLDDDEYVLSTAVPIREVCDNMGKKPYSHALMATALMLYVQNEKK